jgi:hypothetical protein
MALAETRSITLVTAVALAFLAAPAAHSQTPDRQRQPGAVMLRRIAEAVDGHRTGDRVYVVASYEATFPVLGVFANEREAAQRARTAGANAAVFGPYATDRDPGGALLTGCVHVTSSRMHPALCVPPVNAPFPMSEIRTMTLVIRRTNGTTDSLSLARDTDAIFLTLSAIDKFAVPYYTGILGLAATANLRRDIERAFAPRAGQRGSGGGDK